MKYSNIIGIILCGLLVYVCTLHWLYIETPDKFFSGFDSNVVENQFRKPGKLHLYFCIIASILFAIPKIWAKRTNFVFTALNLAWAIRNFFGIGLSCRGGLCPTLLPAFYILFISSILIFIMSLLPKLELKK
jgi:hypothetical protein